MLWRESVLFLSAIFFVGCSSGNRTPNNHLNSSESNQSQPSTEIKNHPIAPENPQAPLPPQSSIPEAPADINKTHTPAKEPQTPPDNNRSVPIMPQEPAEQNTTGNSPKDETNTTTHTQSYKRTPLHLAGAPTASLSLSFNDALPDEPLLAIVEVSEDVNGLDRSAISVEGARLERLDAVTPKLYRLTLMPHANASMVKVHIPQSALVDSDGEMLQDDLDAQASVAQAPWATKIRRYRGIIDATYTYENAQGERATFNFIWIRSGSYTMGCGGADERHCQNNEDAHRVTLTKGFWLGRTEVTQWQWHVVMGNNPAKFAANSQEEQEKLPVEQISYQDALDFGHKLLSTNQWYATLPTEAQWEYAMRSTTTTAYYDNPDDIVGDANSQAAHYIGWYAGNSSQWRYKKVQQPQPANGEDLSTLYQNFYTKPTSVFGTHYIMQKANSDWRMKDMAGNVAEWCKDWYQEHLGSNEANDPSGASSGSLRVVKGGSWYDPAIKLRSAFREGIAPDTRSKRIGLRIAITGDAQ